MTANELTESFAALAIIDVRLCCYSRTLTIPASNTITESWLTELLYVLLVCHVVFPSLPSVCSNAMPIDRCIPRTLDLFLSLLAHCQHLRSVFLAD